MRRLHSLDEDIARAERRLERRRDDLNLDLFALRVRTRRSLTSPAVLLSAVTAGFLIERLGRLKPKRAQRGEKGAMSGIVAGLAAAALRSALSNPQMWQTLREAWARRRASARGASGAALPPPV